MPLLAQEAAAARAARTSVGRAIRYARWRRSHPEIAEGAAATVIPFPKETRSVQRAMLGVALFAVVSLLVVALLPRLRPSPGPAAAAPEQVSAPQPTEAAGGRGRVLASLPPVAAAPAATTPPTAAPTPTQAPAPAPAESAPPAPAPRTAPPGGGVPAGAPGGVPGGAPGGVPGGVVGGKPGGTGTVPSPSETPKPVPQGTPPPQPPGTERFYFQVLDATTTLPLENVCVISGQYQGCVMPNYTNALGYYWVDMTPNNSRWSFAFRLDGYVPGFYIWQYEPGMGVTAILVYMRHR